jgi:hypothetical protein
VKYGASVCSGESHIFLLLGQFVDEGFGKANVERSIPIR